MRTFRPGDRVRLTYAEDLMEKFRGRSGVIVKTSGTFCVVKIPGVPEGNDEDTYWVWKNNMIYDASIYELLKSYYDGDDKK